MEKVYMNVENKNTNRKTWNEGDTSPYDFKEMEMPRNNQRNNYRPYDTYIPQEDELDMRSVRDSFEQYEDEFDDFEEEDMYFNNNINCGCGNHCANNRNGENNENGGAMPPDECPVKSILLEKNTVIEEENPRKTTTIWVRITKNY